MLNFNKNKLIFEDVPIDNGYVGQHDQSAWGLYVRNPINSLINRTTSLLPGFLGDSDEANTVYDKISGRLDDYQTKLLDTNRQLDKLEAQLRANVNAHAISGHNSTMGSNYAAHINQLSDQRKQLLNYQAELEKKIHDYKELDINRRMYRDDPEGLGARFRDIEGSNYNNENQFKINSDLRHLKNQYAALPTGPESDSMRTHLTNQINNLQNKSNQLNTLSIRLQNNEINKEQHDAMAANIMSGKISPDIPLNVQTDSSFISKHPVISGLLGAGALAAGAGGVYGYRKLKQSQQLKKQLPSPPTNQVLTIPQTQQQPVGQ